MVGLLRVGSVVVVVVLIMVVRVVAKPRLEDR